jgi:hypothetical protein
LRHPDHRRLTDTSAIRSLGNVARAGLSAVVVLAVLSACAAQASTPASSPVPQAESTPSNSVVANPSPIAPQDSAQPVIPDLPTEAPPTPGPTIPRVPPLKPPAYASRVVVKDLDIDLPVISGDAQPPPSYPLCDVAAYVTRFSQPYETGVTYISAHAQKGMFAPLLKASQEADGQALIGKRVDVYTNDGQRFSYEIDRVVRHALDYAVLATISFDEQTLVLQTSEGPYGTLEKLQVVAALVEETTVDVAEANPEPHPRDCRPEELGGPPAAP